MLYFGNEFCNVSEVYHSGAKPMAIRTEEGGQTGTERRGEARPMSRIRLVALDLDGTLLGPEHRVSAVNAAAVADCVAAGISVVLASGRSFSSMQPFARHLGLGELICLNGAALGDAASNLVRPRTLLSWEQVALVSDVLRGRGVPFCLFGLRRIVSLPGWATRDTLVPYGEPPIDHVPALAAEHMPDPVKLLAFCEPGPLDDELRAATAGAVDQVRTHRQFLEWVAPGVSKGAALAELMAGLGLARDEVLSIGDSQNDVSLFEQSGVSVAMGNAPAEVAAAARFRTASNAEDGVALALRRFALSDAEG